MNKNELLVNEFLEVVLEYFTSKNESDYGFSYEDRDIVIAENAEGLQDTLMTQELIIFLREHLKLYGCNVGDDGRIKFEK